MIPAISLRPSITINERGDILTRIALVAQQTKACSVVTPMQLIEVLAAELENPSMRQGAIQFRDRIAGPTDGQCINRLAEILRGTHTP